MRQLFFDEFRLKARVSVTFDRAFVVHDIKVIEGKDRLFVAMPNRRDDMGVYRDTVHPITPEFREELEKAVLHEYERCLEYQRRLGPYKDATGDHLEYEPLPRPPGGGLEVV